MIVAIDGTVSSGKSTIAKALAKDLGFAHLNTGAIYRALTIKILNQNATSTEKIVELLRSTTIEQVRDCASGDMKVFLDGIDVTKEIRSPEISREVSTYSKIKEVREYARRVQKKLAATGDWVIEGRDIGTVVFPNAEVKIFMTADLNIRAMRRMKDYIAAGRDVDIETVIKDVVARDKEDMEREISPLKPAEDAVIYYNNGDSISAVIADLTKLVHSAKTQLN